MFRTSIFFHSILTYVQQKRMIFMLLILASILAVALISPDVVLADGATGGPTCPGC